RATKFEYIDALTIFVSLDQFILKLLRPPTSASEIQNVRSAFYRDTKFLGKLLGFGFGQPSNSLKGSLADLNSNPMMLKFSSRDEKDSILSFGDDILMFT